MNKYIDADKLKKPISNYIEGARAALNPTDGDADYYKGKIDACKDIQEFIDSIQQAQAQAEADLSEETLREEFHTIDRMCFDEGISGWSGWQREKLIARHFYELGRTRKVNIMKYINADKLIAEIENTIKAAKKEMKDRDVDSYSDSPYDEKIYARINSTIETCEDIIDTITSLQQEQPEVDLGKVWDWIDKTFAETEIDDSYGESRNVVMSGFDVCKSDLREKYEQDFGLNARKEESK